MLLACFKKAYKHHIQAYRPVIVCSPTHMEKWCLSAVLTQSYLPLSWREVSLEPLSVNRHPVS